MNKSVNQLISDTKNFLSLKKFDEALVSLNLIINKDPKNIAALSTIGDIYVLKKEYDDATKHKKKNRKTKIRKKKYKIGYYPIYEKYKHITSIRDLN